MNIRKRKRHVLSILQGQHRQKTCASTSIGTTGPCEQGEQLHLEAYHRLQRARRRNGGVISKFTSFGCIDYEFLVTESSLLDCNDPRGKGENFGVFAAGIIGIIGDIEKSAKLWEPPLVLMVYIVTGVCAILRWSLRARLGPAWAASPALTPS